jgi:formylglycine-generating enzyme required for sulfatase activity
LEGRRLRDRLLESTTADVPGIVSQMKPYRRWGDRLLREASAQAEEAGDARKQLHISLALLPVDLGQVEFLHGRLLQAQPQECVVIREALADHKQDLTERLWTLLESRQKDQDQRFRAACALAAFAPDDVRWEKVSNDVATMLVIQKPFVIAQWTDALKGAGKWLIPPLADFLVDERRTVAERGMIATVYGTYAANVPDAYARLEKQLTEQPKPGTPVEARVTLARRQASIGTALLVVGRTEQVWPLFKHRSDPTLRSYLIDRAEPGGVDAKILTSWLEEDKEVSIRRAILLSLGEYSVDRLSQDQRLKLLPRLLQVYREDVDPGIHGAAEWLLRQWATKENLKEIDKELATGKIEGKRRWYINRQGQTMVILADVGKFWMGEGPRGHRQVIGRRFALASKEVTVEQFRRFREDFEFSRDFAPRGDCPIMATTLYDAAEYCNWLSKQEGIPKDQWCYEPNKDGKYAEGMKTAPNYWQRTGYRLPSEAEWEDACRAGAETEFSFGEPDDLLGKYAWYTGNSPNRSQSVGTLRPNDNGLFDMHGNAWEWTQTHYSYSKKEDKTEINYDDGRVLCGGSFEDLAEGVRSAFRFVIVDPAPRHDNTGFRPARTIKP